VQLIAVWTTSQLQHSLLIHTAQNALHAMRDCTQHAAGGTVGLPPLVKCPRKSFNCDVFWEIVRTYRGFFDPAPIAEIPSGA